MSTRIPADMGSETHVKPLIWRSSTLRILDQRHLPQAINFIEATSWRDVVQSIRIMAVRGAPAIGIAGAYGAVLAAREHLAAGDTQGFDQAMQELAGARPTAVNLIWALERMAALRDNSNPAEVMLAMANRIAEEDREMTVRMAGFGSALLEPGSRVLTHCNTGALATGGIGTAFGVIRQAHETGRLAAIWFTETRPWMQGARLTAWEFSQAGIPATLLTEGAVASVTRQPGIDWLIVGADRIAANGDTANKIGTLTLAMLVKAAGGRVMVVAPESTIDMSIASAADIPIENREPRELLHAANLDEPLPHISVFNPAFDITPAHLIDVVVTDRGCVFAPDADTLRMHLADPLRQDKK